ncbi:3-isopropylmalate dehydratase small subunit [candidate division NPL-UPA2 bacterium]|nr:3-isopropylmalate dehydratase small subunit [candidate division NPL-UPA2 bacterium]
MNKLRGRAYKFGDDINTDLIISGKYKFSTLDMKELAKHLLEDIDPAFSQKIKPGKSFIVAGRNFGCGSSREQAPLAIKESEICAVVAKSFARIFYRNCINVGLPVIECDTDGIEEGDCLEVSLEKGTLRNETKEVEEKISSLPQVMIDIISEGGLVEYFRKRGGFKLEP